uniref:Dynein intermediate chain 3, ciliary n=1 Tax=Cacopsylla melanoneura TaxID=428564 RepID=A0A8D8Z7X5_9HEMI
MEPGVDQPPIKRSVENKFFYTKKRSEFGRPYEFECDEAKLLLSLEPDPTHLENFIPEDPVEQGVQYSKQFSLHEANTFRAEYESHCIYHEEGGWPKDISHQDTEQIIRYKRKVEKDETYIQTVMHLSHPMEHCIHQNNAINIYEQYFDNVEPSIIVEDLSSRTLNVFRDQQKVKRPIQKLSWSPDGGSRIAGSYCNLNFQNPVVYACESYVWDVDNPNKPYLVLKGPACVCSVEYNPKDIHCLIGGLLNGQVAFWDDRKGSSPVEISDVLESHRAPVNNALWINSKTNTEFFTSSIDGCVRWWDCRNLKKPTETLLVDTTKEEQKYIRALGVSTMEYEPTIPVRFLLGTETGMVIIGNRKSKTSAEKLATVFKAHKGPVYSVARNPAFLKNFLTIGDYCARVWSEDVKESAIMSTGNHNTVLTCGGWSATKYSVFYVTKTDGCLDVWDLLQNQRNPTLTVKVCDDRLNTLRCNDNGEMVAVGSSNGSLYLIQFSDNLVTANKNDKMLLTSMFERETRREKIIEAKQRELRLKARSMKNTDEGMRHAKTKGQEADQGGPTLEEEAETEFFVSIDEVRLWSYSYCNQNK